MRARVSSWRKARSIQRRSSIHEKQGDKPVTKICYGVAWLAELVLTTTEPGRGKKDAEIKARIRYGAAWLAELRLTTTESGRGKKDSELRTSINRGQEKDPVTRIWYGPAMLAELGLTTAGPGRSTEDTRKAPRQGCCQGRRTSPSKGRS